MKMDTLMLTREGKKEIAKFITSERQVEVSGGTKNGNQDEEIAEASCAGCTACVVLISKTEIYCANAGDSRAVLSKKGKAKELSSDHKPDNPSEKRRIERANGFVEESRVNGMLGLSRALGDFEYKGNSLIKPQD